MTPYIFLKKDLNKFWLIYVIIFVLFFAWPVIAISQQKEMGQGQLLALPSKAIRLDSLSNRIARETRFVFSFNASKINPGKKISFPSAKIKLDALLSYLHKRYQITHKTIGNHIILYYDKSFNKKISATSKSRKDRPLPKQPDILNKENASGTLLGKETKPINLTALPDIGTGVPFKSAPIILPKEFGKTLTKQNLIPPINSAKSIPYPERKLIKSFISRRNYTEKQTGAHRINLSKGNNRFNVSAGLTASEVLYVNPQIRAGLPWLFALAAWGTNFKASGFFYGLGTSINLSDSWSFQLSASSGKLYKKFGWPFPTSDTMMRIKARLTRINLLAEKHLGNRWTLQCGPVVNFMKSNYSLTNPSMANSPPISTNLSKEYYILRPPYTISKSYNEETSSGKKVWIGLQVGLFYRLW